MESLCHGETDAQEEKLGAVRERLGCLNRKWRLMCSTSIYLASCPSGGRQVHPEDNMETKSCSRLVHKTLLCVCSSRLAPLLQLLKKGLLVLAGQG